MKKSKGFTLIELMIVVAIIGILAAVAIPKFANLIRQANEASCKGNLGAIRSALSIYYGSNEGIYPSTIGALVPNYMAEIPNAKCGAPGYGSANTEDDETDGTVSYGSSTKADDDGDWWYNSGRSKSGQYEGTVKVDAQATDTKGTAIHSW